MLSAYLYFLVKLAQFKVMYAGAIKDINYVVHILYRFYVFNLAVWHAINI